MDHIKLLREKAISLQDAQASPLEIIKVLEQILEYTPADVRLILNLADICYHYGKDANKARKYYEMLYERNPNNAWVMLQLCKCLIIASGDRLERMDNFIRAYEIAKKLLDIDHSKLEIAEVVQFLSLRVLDYDSCAKLGSKKDLMLYWAESLDNRPFSFQMSAVEAMQDRLDLLEAHRVWGANIEKEVSDIVIKHRVRQRLNNKARIGIASIYLRSNYVGNFIWPLIEHLDRDRFELYCYSFLPDNNDKFQQNVIAIADGFKECHPEESYRITAQKIADDGLDALIEISAGFQKPKVIACKPAALQISWLDYPHSTGLSVDHIVVDGYTNPESSDLLIEKPLVVPIYMVIDKDKYPHIPICKYIPQKRNGYITFGTMNAPFKITMKVFKVWAEIMNMTPNSRFLCVRSEAVSGVFQDNFRRYMGQYGISHDRISFITTKANPMDYYNNIDIALDTFPRTGGATTCETLWMGVPVVTLVGPALFERISYSNVSNAGLDDLAAFNLQDYKDIALNLVIDKDRRSYLRQNLRQQILNSPLGQPKQFAKGFSDTIATLLGKGK